MSTEISTRDKRIAAWWFQDVLGYTGETPKGNNLFVHMKSMMDMAAADGVLAEAERKWAIGFASVCGLDEDIVDQLTKYQPGTAAETTNMFDEADMPYVKTAANGLIYFSIRTASADGELHAKEAAAIAVMAKKLGVTDEKLAEIHALASEDEKMRQKRSAVLYPHGVGTAIEEFKKKFS